MRKFAFGMMTGLAVALVARTALPLAGNLALSPVMAAAPTTDPAKCSPTAEAANLALIDSLAPVPGKGMDPAHYLTVMSPDFVQHNPDSVRFAEINNLTGREAMVKLLDAMKKVGFHIGPPPGAKMDLAMFAHPVVMVQCDYVFELSQMPVPDPQRPGSTYTAFGFDLYRIKDGKVAEHWDATRIGNPPPAYLAAPIDQLKPAAPPS